MKPNDERSPRRATARVLIPLIVASINLAVLPPAFGAAMTLAGHTISFEPPEGYCLLNERGGRERDIIRAMRQMQQRDNRLLWMFAPCEQLADLRTGKEERLQRYGHVLAVQPSGILRPLRGASRFEFARKVARWTPLLDVASLSRHLQEPSAAHGGARFKLLHSGIIGVDAAAAYLAAVTEENVGKKRARTAGVTAITVVNELPVSIALHAPFSGMEAYQALRAELKPMLGSFISLNEPGTDPFYVSSAELTSHKSDSLWRADAAVDWRRALWQGMIGAAVGGLVGFAAWIYRKTAAL